MNARPSLRRIVPAAVLLLSMPVLATMVRQMNLGEMTVSADRIVHGTITAVETGTVAAGGGELPTITYVVQVAEVLKGNASTDAGNRIRVTMFGSLKKAQTGSDVKRISSIYDGPNLKVGREYLLFLTRPSSAGLSTTVGVGQGAFRFLDDGTVVNEAKNAGLFRDMDRQGLPASGPVDYRALADRIEQLVAN